MAVLPACHLIDFDRPKEMAGAGSAQLAHEDEFATIFPGCEVGSTAAPKAALTSGARRSTMALSPCSVCLLPCLAEQAAKRSAHTTWWVKPMPERFTPHIALGRR